MEVELGFVNNQQPEITLFPIIITINMAWNLLVPAHGQQLHAHELPWSGGGEESWSLELIGA